MTISLDDFDSVSECETGRPLMIKNPDGSDTGLTLTVLGAQADVVKRNVEQLINKARREEAARIEQQSKSKKVTVEEIDLEKQLEENVSAALVRVVGWEGVDEEFAPDRLKKALKRNPHWCAQIIDFSGELGNFTSLKAAD